MKTALWKVISLFTLLVLANLLLAAFVAHAQAPDPLTRTGILLVRHGDGYQGSSYQRQYVLHTDGGEALLLRLDETLIASAGGISAVDRQWVEIQLAAEPVLSLDGRSRAASVTSLRPITNGVHLPREVVNDEVRYINLMCKFNGNSSEPTTKAYLDDVFSAAGFPRMPDYWSVSSRAVSVTADTKTWKTLPGDVASYVNSEDMLSGIFADCTAKFDANVDFSQYDGINIILNAPMALNGSEGYAWGGGGISGPGRGE